METSLAENVARLLYEHRALLAGPFPWPADLVEALHKWKEAQK